MGTYNLSTDEIIDAIKNAIENLEGDYSDKQLIDALNFIIEEI